MTNKVTDTTELFFRNYEANSNNLVKRTLFFQAVNNIELEKVLQMRWTDLATNVDGNTNNLEDINWDIYTCWLLNWQFDRKNRYKELLEGYTVENTDINGVKEKVSIYEIQDRIRNILQTDFLPVRSICFVFEKKWQISTSLSIEGYITKPEDKESLFELVATRDTLLNQINEVYIAGTKGRVNNIVGSGDDGIIFNAANEDPVIGLDKHHNNTAGKGAVEMSAFKNRCKREYIYRVLRSRFSDKSQGSKSNTGFKRNLLLELYNVNV